MSVVFFHIDLDAFFASVEILDHPEYKGKPLIIGSRSERSVVSTCSYEARKYGVHSAMPMSTALRLCPNALVVEPRMRRYSEKSHEVMSIIRDFAPGFLQVSVDEAFLNLSNMENIYGLPGKAARILKQKIKDEMPKLLFMSRSERNAPNFFPGLWALISVSVINFPVSISIKL